MAFEDITPEEQAKIDLVRLLVGDVPGSLFFPALTDEEYYAVLELEKWNVNRAAIRAAISISFKLSAFPYRERTGDIEVWNNASLQYLKVLQLFLDGGGSFGLPPDIIPYAAGISKLDVCSWNKNPDANRSPLTQITPCHAWWTGIKNYPCCDDDGNLVFLK